MGPDFRSRCRLLKDPITLIVEEVRSPLHAFPSPEETFKNLTGDNFVDSDVALELLTLSKEEIDQLRQLGFVKKTGKGAELLELTAARVKKIPEPLLKALSRQKAVQSWWVSKGNILKVSVAAAEAERILGRKFNPSRTEPISIEELMGDFVKAWSGRCSECEGGPNCFHAALAAQGDPKFSKPRFVDTNELQAELQKNYDLLPEGEKMRFGDLFVMSHDGVVDGVAKREPTWHLTHAAFFVGQDKEERKIFFTKNGAGTTKYIFMDMDTLVKTYKNNYYPVSSTYKLEFYRPKVDEKGRFIGECKIP